MVTKLAGDAEVKAVSAATQADSLHAAVSGEIGAQPVVLLHGLFGMGSNLGALARDLQDRFEVHQLDLPNHGRSPWCAQMTISSMALAIAGYLRERVVLPAHVVGHSLSGKVAMQLALTHADLVASLTVADIAPVAYPGSHDQVFAAIAAVEAAQAQSRREAAQVMRRFLQEEGVVQFLSLSLHRGKDRTYQWRFNARALRENYAALREAPVGDVYAGPALFISGDRSPYVQEAGVEAARAFFPAAQFVVIQGTGHWLHAEKPAEFNAKVRDFLENNARPEQ